jgi:hypothetical protein
MSIQLSWIGDILLQFIYFEPYYYNLFSIQYMPPAMTLPYATSWPHRAGARMHPFNLEHLFSF